MFASVKLSQFTTQFTIIEVTKGQMALKAEAREKSPPHVEGEFFYFVHLYDKI